MDLGMVSMAVSAQLGQAAPGSPMEHALGLAGSSLGMLGFLCSLATVKLGFVGMALWSRALWPNAADRALEFYRAPGSRCFWIGAVNGVGGVFLVLLLLATKILAPLALAAAVGLLAAVALGYGTCYRHLGQRLWPSLEEKSSPLAQVLGGLVCEAGFLFPLLGQLLSAGVLFKGLGAVVLTVFALRREKRANAVVAVPESAQG